MVVFSELEEGVPMNEVFVKEITGEDGTGFRELYGKEVNRPITFVPFFSTNEIPQVTRDPALWRRLTNVQWSAMAEDQKPGVYKADPELKDLVKTKEYLESWLYWFIQGA
ncbi:hypothetical protein CAOG_04459 [Capsaspora owczarzaki ATCC 30864]|uniref:Uncharacterized protein n=1 Tax=Capsaspora owczarzaki (strain ATCC 30864) TaxID=595528 RepID=A0A0D2WQ53_CAPO3|nr:hypothetical protein CAOG_04459 [Capsaspora owczarzaki ATCC 30864]KJE93705.1 hypothetical protein CAOG_004459 [Capsaspora owczarzaki ATCC 30864]|eukprot:XP_004348287.1 hypothetical protein CAOG_04459 [Capsaspora owczarzaki ATCC 30864]